MVTQLKDKDFSTKIKQSENVIVKYYADWCGTCRLFAPKFESLSTQSKFKSISFFSVNAEESPIARKLVGVNALPFFAIFKNGVLVRTETSAKLEVLETLLSNYLN